MIEQVTRGAKHAAWRLRSLRSLRCNPALSVTALAVTSRDGDFLAAASAVPGAGFASRGIVSRPPGEAP